MLTRANEAGHIKGVVSHLIPGRWGDSLAICDDTMVLIEPTGMGIANLKFLLLFFENMLRLKINFDKSEVFMTGFTPKEKRTVADILNYKLGSLPRKYLGLPLSDHLLRVADWGFLPDKVGHRVDPWQGIFLALAGRLELTNSCLSSLPMFPMGIYLLHDATHLAMDRTRNPSKEIFSELDETFAQGPIFARSFQKTEDLTKWGHEAARGWPARPSPWPRALPPGPLVWPLALTFRLLKAPVAKPPVPRATIRKTLQRRRRRESHLWDSEIASGTLPERGFISRGLFIAMIASGVMSE
ncbi:hypothetical protein QYE76_031445 [Lolium multiflorum]|uniref:Reverse transcriptase domain-containing protein n=1 Tax=Lolium multiflorum TaxID=4521 RepID=A0AAD8VHG0_LOLMU|nr:hypothetical protein QYE76_031445 [Lolium multiflorum]